MSQKDYDRGYQEAVNLYRQSSKDYYAFLESVPKDTDYRRGLEAGRKEAEKLVIERDQADKVEKNYKYAYNVGYWLMKGDEKAYDQFVKNLQHKDNSVYRGYVAGGKQAAMERVQQRLRQALKTKGKDLELDGSE